VEIHGNAIITPAQVDGTTAALSRQAQFEAVRERILSEYDGLIRRLTDA
jgi:hypothetical protein